MLSYWDVIKEIEKLPHYREYVCHKCDYKQKVFILLIQKNCENCGIRTKLRSYGSIGSEIEDVLDTVLEWMGKGEEFNDLIKWKQIRDSFADEDKDE